MTYLREHDIRMIAKGAVLRQKNQWQPPDKKWRDEDEFQAAYLEWRVLQQTAVEDAIREALKRSSFWQRLF